MIPVELQVIGSSLRAIAEEMGAVLVRSAFSSNIKERRDCSTALFDRAGRMGIAERYLELVGDDVLAERVFGVLRAEHDRARDAVLEIVEAHALLDRHPVLQESIRLRNPYVDPMNAIQVELLRRYRDPEATEGEREELRRPLLRSIAGIAAALRNTG